MAGVTFKWIATLLVIVGNAEAGQQVLFFTSSGKVGSGNPTLAGIYGGALSISNKSIVGNSLLVASNLYQRGRQCGKSDDHEYHGLVSHTSSFDPISKTVVIQGGSIFSSNRVTAFSFNYCEGPPWCDTIVDEITPVNFIFDRLLNSDEPRANIGPFAVWDNIVYFIVYRHTGTKAQVSSKIELRKLEGCESIYPLTDMTGDLKDEYLLDIDNCSSLVTIVSTIGRHRIHESIHSPLLALKQLFVTKGNLGLKFLLQVLDYTSNYERCTTNLLVINPESTLSVTSVLHVGQTGSEHCASGNSLPHVGSIDYKDGTLCFSNFDYIVCAEWDGLGELRNKRTAVNSREVGKACPSE